MNAPRRLLQFAALACGLALAGPAAAMTYEPTPDGDIIRANGPIEPGDADKLRQLLTGSELYKHGIPRFGTTLHLNSPGGSVVAGMELANAIRQAGLMTHVSSDSGCYSACTFVFLGGVRRTVEGKFGIHAMSKGRSQTITIYSDTDFDAVQLLTSTLINLAQSLVGDSRMITAMLTVPGSDIKLVPDNFLAEWRVITTASRPSQRMTASFDCGKSGTTDVEKMVCDHLVLADADRRMAAAYEWLTKTKAVERLNEDQERWISYRNSCRNALGPNRSVDVLACVREAYEIRLKQLEGLVSFHDASKSTPAAASWKPLPPLEELNPLQQRKAN